MQILYLLYSISIHIYLVYANLIVNGGFQDPSLWVIPILYYSSITGWTGSFCVINTYPGLGHGQHIDMSTLFNEDGYIMQYITLPTDGQYLLTFYQKAQTNNFLSCVVNIYWNGVLVATKIPNTTATTLESLILNGVAGTNRLKFQQTGIYQLFNYDSMLIDQVSLTPYFNQFASNNTNTTNSIPINITNVTNSITNITNTTNLNNITINSTNLQIYTNTSTKVQNAWQVKTISAVLGLPFNKAVSARYAYLFFQDLWLYNYGDTRYEGVVQSVFDLDVQIQLMKNNFYNAYLGWEQYKSYLLISDHVPFTRQRFIEIEGSSSILIDCNFSYFIYTIPSNIIIVLALFILFKVLRKYEMSKFFRKYSFFVQTLSQTLLQGNIVYLTYVCFSHLQNAWAIKFADKNALIITITILYLLFIFCLSFYFLIGRHKQKACYFIYNFYRCHQSYIYLTAKNLLRNFGRGAIFFYLHSQYVYKLLFLGVVEITIVYLALAINLNEQIFISKTAFCLELCYHLLFLTLNLSLYFQYLCQQTNIIEVEKLSLQWQGILIVLLVSIVFLIMILDFVPLHYLKKIDFIKNLFKGIEDNGNEKSKKKQGKTVRKKLQQMIESAELARKGKTGNKSKLKFRFKVKSKQNIKVEPIHNQKFIFTLKQIKKQQKRA